MASHPGKMMIIVYSNFEHFSDWLSAFLLLEFKIFQNFHLTLFLFTATKVAENSFISKT